MILTSAKLVICGLLGAIQCISGSAIHLRPFSENFEFGMAETNGVAVAGREVQIEAKEYMRAFRSDALKLGDCAMKLEDRIKVCSEKFGGEAVLIPKASTVVDVSRVQSSEDILTHVMGGIGISVGVLGLASVSVKVNVAVTTKTNSKTLNLMSSYDLQRGTMTLHNPQPLTPVGTEGILYLSEIQLGGNEVLLVNMEFESESKRTEVEVAVKVKILFITISAKMKYIEETFKTASSVQIRFVSSWRPQLDFTFSSLVDAIAKVEEIEEMYISGPAELMEMDITNASLHNFYTFSSWNKGPYGNNANAALIHSDLKTLTDQYAEAKSVSSEIKEMYQWVADAKRKEKLKDLERTLDVMSRKLTKAMNDYHSLDVEERTKLHDIYGINVAPLYYRRKLNGIMKD